MDVGVTRLIANNASRILVDTARAHGIETHSYVALNSHGGVRMRFAWSCEFIRPPISTPEATAILNTHRPIWSSPNAQPRMSDFARTHQELRGQNRERRDELQPYERLQLSPIFPEMRRHEIGRYLDLLEKSGADGVQAEFVLANEDADGIDTNGYETAMVNAYRAQTGHDPFTLPNNTPDWIQFRADQVKPRPAVFVLKGLATLHLFNIGRWVVVVGVKKGDACLFAQGLANGTLARA